MDGQASFVETPSLGAARAEVAFDWRDLMNRPRREEDDAVGSWFDSGEAAPGGVVEEQISARKPPRPVVEIVGEAQATGGKVRAGVRVLGQEVARQVRGHRHFHPVRPWFGYSQARQRRREGVAQGRLEPRPHLPVRGRALLQGMANGWIDFAMHTNAAGLESSAFVLHEGQQLAAPPWREEVRSAHERHHLLGLLGMRRRIRRHLAAQNGSQPGGHPITRPQREGSPIARQRLAEPPLGALHFA